MIKVDLVDEFNLCTCAGCGSVTSCKLLHIKMYNFYDNHSDYLCDQCLESLFTSLERFRKESTRGVVNSTRNVDDVFSMITRYIGDKPCSARVIEKLPDGNTVTLFYSCNVDSVQEKFDFYRAQYIAAAASRSLNKHVS